MVTKDLTPGIQQIPTGDSNSNSQLLVPFFQKTPRAVRM